MTDKPLEPLCVHAFEPFSEVDGPGVRAVLWLEGCTPGRPGCFEPEAHGDRDHEVAVDELFAHIAVLGGRIEGVTISGGEPLRRFRPLLRLLTRIREETSLSVLVLSGHGWEEIVRMPGAAALRERVDVLVAGRHRTVHLFTGRYRASDLGIVPGAPARPGIGPPDPGG